MAYQSLYRRYRPQKFSEIRGQPHLVAALQNAVARNEVGHAYLFHGPRGTGKTSAARVLAKALNCENPGDDAEPCGECESCAAIEAGRSFDLHELDAASNNGVEDMRDLLAKVSLGNPGRAKVYILDEVHMLTRGAENALLKTLEEPPEHVIWVLATTEPHKVAETIRSRCQVFPLGLLGAQEMTDHVRWVVDDAGLDIDDAAIDHVVTVGGGSVRDTLSALDRVVAAGGLTEIDESTDLLLSSLADRDATVALASVAEAMARGRDPRTIGESVLAGLRDAFLAAMGTPSTRLTAPEATRAADISGRMAPASLTRALETIGTALVEMRQAPDPRVDLEVALVRLCRPDADRSLDALIERIDRLEAALGGETGAAPLPVEPPPTESPPRERPAESAASAPPPPPSEPPAGSAVPPPPRSPEPATVAADDGAPRSSRGPAAAARKALADAGGSPASARVPDTPSPSAPLEGPDPAPPVTESEGLSSIQPDSPRHVVQLAAEHLRVEREVVVRRATELLGPAGGPRPPADLARLWVALVEEHSGSAGEPEPAPEPAPPQDRDGPAAADPVDTDAVDTDPVDTDPDDTDPVDTDADHIDLSDLIDAPARSDEVVERLTEAFPGAELHAPEEPEP